MYQGQVPLQTLGQTQNLGINTGTSFEPVREQQDDSEPDSQSESNHRNPEPWNRPPQQADIDFRIKELHNRHFLLLKMQCFRKKIEENGVGTTEGMTCEDSDQLCELEAIKKELDELLVTKEELEKQRSRFKPTAHEGQQGTHPTFYKTEAPRGGIYMLPPPQLAEDDVTLERRGQIRLAAERPTSSVIPVDLLGQTPAVTKCPSCDEVIITETRSKAGEATWTICFLCVLTGCVAGCCLIPFCMKRLRNVQHQCPHCQANVHTHQPF